MNEVEKLLASQIGAMVIEGAKMQIALQTSAKEVQALKAELEALKALRPPTP